MGFRFQRVHRLYPNMKLNWNAGCAVIIGIVTSRLVSYFINWSYNPFRDPFVFWKLIVEFGVPIAAVLVWLWIIQMVVKPRSK